MFAGGESPPPVNVAEDVREEKDASKHEASPGPVEGGEAVVEVPDGEQEADELPGGEDEAGGEAGALAGQHEHGEDADVLQGDVGGQVQHHHGHLQLHDGNVERAAGHADPPVLHNVLRQEAEEWQGEGVAVEQSLLGVFPISRK